MIALYKFCENVTYDIRCEDAAGDLDDWRNLAYSGELNSDEDDEYYYEPIIKRLSEQNVLTYEELELLADFFITHEAFPYDCLYEGYVAKYQNMTITYFDGTNTYDVKIKDE